MFILLSRLQTLGLFIQSPIHVRRTGLYFNVYVYHPER